MYLLIEMFFKIIGYSLACFGLWLLIGKPFLMNVINDTLKDLKRKRRVKRLKEMAAVEKTSSNAMLSHLELVLSSVFKSESKGMLYNFLFLTFTLFGISTLFFLLFLRDFLMSIGASLFIATLPYIILRYRLSSIRLHASYVFLKEFHIIVQNYQTSNGDIYESITRTYEQTQDLILKKLLIKLANAINLQRNPSDFRNAVKIFIYSIDTSFAKRFGNLVLKSHIEQRDILEPLVQLNRDIEKRKVKMEEEKSRNLDTVMLGVSSLFAPLGAFVLVYYLSGVIDFWYYFKLKQNFSLYLLCCVASIVSFFAAMILRRPKADL